MKSLAYLLTALLISGCITPGMEEPDVWICVIVDDVSLTCHHSLDKETRREVDLIDAIGYQCVTPTGYAKIKTHHQILHDELNKKKK